jgi:excisionase family DNA binding protein
MPHYMVQFSYSPQVWAGLIEQPEDRTAAVRGLIEGVGGRLVGLYWAFGDYDGVAIFEAPDNIAIGGAMVRVLGAGVFSAVKTTPLFTAREGQQLLALAGRASYRPPAMTDTFLDRTFRGRQARHASSEQLMALQELRVEEAAQLFGLSPAVIRSAVFRHELPATMAGHTIVSIKRADLLKWVGARHSG